MIDNRLVPPEPPFPRRHPIATACIVAAVIVLVVGIGGLVFRQAEYCGAPSDLFAYPKSTVTLENGTSRTECTGVSDSFPFRPDTSKVMAALAKENAYAVAGGNYVTVALAGPLSLDEPRMLHRIEGAVVGQHDANRENLTGATPRIRLVLANMDSNESSWRTVTRKLVDMSRGDDHLVAVAGIGLSQDETVSAIKLLSAAHVAVIGDMLTADTIRNGPGIDDLFRTGPTTDDQLRALGRYFRPRWKDWRSVIVAYSKLNDLYTRALADEFKKYLDVPWARGGSKVYPFGENPGNEFQVIADNMCSAAHINTVFYAGRAHDLPTFVNDLSNRNCHDAPITVVSTSDTSRLAARDPANTNALKVLEGKKGKPVTLIYTPLAEPSLLAPARGRTNQFTAFRGRFTNMGFDGADLDTGWAITEHDAVLAASKAVRLASGNSQSIPAPNRVLEMLRLIQSKTYAVPGATGQVKFQQNGNEVLPSPPPILRFNPGGRPVRLD